MKNCLGFFCSALLGGFFAAWLLQGDAVSHVAAQNPAAAPPNDANRGPNFPAPPRSVSPRESHGHSVEFNPQGLTPEETVNIAIYANCNRSVVNITTQSLPQGNIFLMDTPGKGSGSGAILDHAGHVLTNYHVISDAREVEVTLFDGESYEARFVGADPINDLAILKIDAPKETLFPVKLGDSGNLKVGMKVFAIGNPFGLERTMTTGIISSLNRSIQVRANRSIRSIIQIDADINPGNSGGPLLNAHGQLIGINTAIASQNGQSAGVGFAIPVNLAKRVVPQLIKHGRVIRPDIGIARVYETDQGLRIAKLTPGGPAEKANLKGPQITRSRRGVFIVERVDRSAADLIVEVDGRPVESTDEFLTYIESRPIGSDVELTIIRDGKKLVVPVTLGKSE